MGVFTPIQSKVPQPRTQDRIQERITGDGPLIPVILRLAGPVVLMMYLQGAYLIIDTMWVGQLLGQYALAGIATGGFVLWSIFGLTNLVTVGSSALLARRIGEGDVKAAEYIATKGIWYAFLLSVVIGVGLWQLMPNLFRLMGTNPAVTEQGSNYLRIILLGSPVLFLSFTLQRIFQAEGDTVTPMWLMFFALIINTALDPMLMLGLFGFPPMGVAGAALATVIARLFMVVCMISLLSKRRRITTMRWQSPFLLNAPLGFPSIQEGRLQLRFSEMFGWDGPLLRSILRIGLPTAVSQTMFPFVYMIITRLPAAYGSEYVAALRIGHTAEGLSFFLALGFSIAAATCLGQNLGARRPDRAARAGWLAAAVVAAILFVFSLLFFVFSRQIGAMFSSDPGTIEASSAYLEILAISQVFMGIEIVLGGAFAGAGDTVPPMVILVPLNLARIPLAYALAVSLGLGISGVWWAITGTTVAKGLILAFWFHRGQWKNKEV
jgi:putative MATE family efflux protein